MNHTDFPAAVMVEAPRAREPVELSIEPPEAAMLDHPPTSARSWT